MWTDEDMDEIAATEPPVSLANYRGEKMADRAAAKGLPGLIEWIFLGEVL